LHERLRRLGNRIDAETHGKVLGAVHARIPMVTADEPMALQTENAERDARFWSRMRDMHAERIKGHEQLAAEAAEAIAGGRTAVTDATGRAEAAQERV
jgi:head-tail adaptor